MRVNPSDESIARAVSTVAQLCDKSEFDNLAEKMEAGQVLRFYGLAVGLATRKTMLDRLTSQVFFSSEDIQQKETFNDTCSTLL